LKEELILRAIGSKRGYEKVPIHDYLVKLEGVGQARLSEFAGHFPPKRDDFDPYNSWQKTLFGRLWPAVPMVSRDDAPGEIIVSVQNPPGVLKSKRATPQEGSNLVFNASFPHLSRLYEISQKLQALLLPKFPLHSLSSSQTKDPVLEKKLLASREVMPNLLAQGPPPIPAPITATPQIDPARSKPGAVHYSVTISNTIEGGGPHRFDRIFVTVTNHNTGISQKIEMSNVWQKGGEQFTWKSERNSYLPPAAIDYKPGDKISVTAQAVFPLSLPGYTGGQPTTPNASCTGTVSSTGVIVAQTCGTAAPPITAGPAKPSCGNPDIYTPQDFDDPNAIEDKNNPPNLDTICTDPKPIKAFLEVKNYQAPVSKQALEQAEKERAKCPGCDIQIGLTLSRKIGLDLLIPYLSNIWDQTGGPQSGLFHIFTPRGFEFEPLAAKAPIDYRFSPGQASPSEGSFFYPFLGGVQKAKKWVIQTLTPK
ncbi:hypothetical protein HZB97_03940, partial [Candidatus Gottesmanbacteria bacterium]|nr:hypothetical protein [Candidatus Gottesmanbacteria bacterium]